ncbi:probable nuclease HARBI1 [Coccomyxa sp. Obi]|nr:probable nuclease HARBI1 [Coccomyxa sp. Obi]
MTKRRVGDLWRELGPEIERQTTRLRNPVCSEKRLMITLHWLSTGLRFKDLADTWAIGTATAQMIVRQVVPAMDNCISHRSIVFPVGQELEQVMTDFETLMGLEQCGGAIDGTFVKIKRPSGDFGFRYWCYKGFDALLVLATVDARGVFTCVKAGSPGSVGDAGVYSHTDLKNNIESGVWLSPAAGMQVSGVFVRPYLVGDAAFAFSNTMMKGYNGNPREGTLEHAYNYAHIRTRRVVENAFGILKARFQILKGTNLNDVKFMTRVICLCCALHNMCMRNNDPWEDDWFPIQDPRGPVHDVRVPQGNPLQGPEAPQAALIRAALARNVREKGGF